MKTKTLKFENEAAMTKWVKSTGIKFGTSMPLNGDQNTEQLATEGMVTATCHDDTIYVFYPINK